MYVDLAIVAAGIAVLFDCKPCVRRSPKLLQPLLFASEHALSASVAAVVVAWHHRYIDSVVTLLVIPPTVY